MALILKNFSLTELLTAAAVLVVILFSSAYSLNKDEFPSDFVFGVSTSAYQFEGAANEDGRKPSIWDTFAHGGNANMYEGDGDIACDGYHKYKEDVELMANMGLDAYRFSISWSRLIPDGKGPINPKGLQYYNNLINELINHGIEAHVTLHHWDLPQSLEDEYEGWVSKKIVKDFTSYVDVCFREFGDRVKYWTTVNEVNVYAMYGYDIGMAPPQRCSPSFAANCSRGNSSAEPYLVAHHMLLAHASAARLYRKKYKGMQHGFIGFNLLTFGFVPLTNTSEDIVATQRAQDFMMGWVLNPLTFGDYPDIMKKNAGSRLPSFTIKESNLIKNSIDFLGINFYNLIYVKNSPASLNMEDRDYTQDMAVEITVLIENDTSIDEFPITTKNFQEVLYYLKNDYGNFPIYIHENGHRTFRNSSLNDWSRVKYLHKYIETIANEIRSGSNIKGYFVWSFMDVLEILSGYEESFGLYYIDMKDPNLKRQPKLSAKWYSDFLKRKPMDSKIIMEIENDAPLPSEISLL
ncbi:putative beta-glucosidase [Medicago truncatula]|uniref:Glycoside hydrolase family protein n=1 Tax=Medicago truncatula TaxID=3880 RepID=A0A072U0J3_MEDTR|nr:beta-glucosidase 11 isoform X2 [Medicago truncatula]KEH23192.1 glycoside hydrolase family protein [Medicago truncatula]RHN46482.1 putative beta-glucosidase [Medicago truncatula]